MGTFDQFVAALDADSLVSFEVPGSLRDDPECVYSVGATWFGDALLVSARDITEQKRAEAGLAEVGWRYRVLAENASGTGTITARIPVRFALCRCASIPT